MRKSTLAAGAVAVLAVLTAGAALAQQAPARGVRGDADGDGRVSRAEFIDGPVARLAAIDADRDGSISAEERRASFEARRSEWASARFAALDKDGNGEVSREEFTAGRGARGDRAEHAGRGARHVMRGGAHRGGEARGPLTIADVQTRLTTQFDRIDADHDGYITAEERAAARQAMRGQRGERRAAGQPSPSAPASE